MAIYMQKERILLIVCARIVSLTVSLTIRRVHATHSIECVMCVRELERERIALFWHLHLFPRLEFDDFDCDYVVYLFIFFFATASSCVFSRSISAGACSFLSLGSR